MSERLQFLDDAGTEAACFRLWRELANTLLVATFTVDGEPVSKARARFTGYGSKTRAYTPQRTSEAEERVAWTFRAAARSHRPNPDRAYGVFAIFFCGTRQRRDVDNMLKLILDGLNGVAWTDDNQVAEISARKSYASDPAHARTEVAVYDLGTIQRPTTPCEQCGAPLRSYPSLKRKFCGPACQSAHRAERRTKTCPSCSKRFIEPLKNMYCSPECQLEAGTVVQECRQCGESFRRPKSWSSNGLPMCSTECRATYWRGQKALNAKGTCAQCGGPTSKKSYTRCRSCQWGRPVELEDMAR